VLIKRKYKATDHRTASGIYIIGDTSFRPALHADRIGEVIKVPDTLFFHLKSYDTYPYGGESMPWDCDMELQPGDTVVHTFMERHDIVNIEVDDEPGELYRLMPYDDIYVARRGDKVIPLNGYCLCEEVEKEKFSSVLDLVHEDPVDKEARKPAYVGKPNRKYRESGTDDGSEISPGDIIIKRRGDIHIRLEEDLHRRFFDSPVMYFIIQRRDIYAKKL